MWTRSWKRQTALPGLASISSSTLQVIIIIGGRIIAFPKENGSASFQLHLQRLRGRVTP